MGEEDTMVPGKLYTIMDFSINDYHDHREETQAKHFAREFLLEESCQVLYVS